MNDIRVIHDTYARIDTERFWSKVLPPANPANCWQWLAGKHSQGYGMFKIGTQMYLAHRLTYEALIEKIPTGYTLDHLCRNTSCVNPWHLQPVTQKENTLRGNGPTAKHNQQTHCKYGHLLEYDNLRKCDLKRGHRQCIICDRRRGRERSLRLKVIR